MRALLLKKREKWVPKKWKPKYENIVLFSASGKSNGEIAAAIGYTEQQVSNILNTPQALETLRRICSNAGSKFQQDFGARIESLTDVSLRNVENVLKNDSLLKNVPLAMFDRSITFLKSAGKLTGERVVQNNMTNIMIGADVQKALVTGLEKATRVMEIHGGTVHRKEA
jgi:hypothetical protein